MSTRIEGIIDRLTDAESFDDIKWIVGDGIVRNYAQSIVDDHIKANAEFQAQAGLEVTVERISVGKTCDWCLKRCGKYTYPDVPDNLWERHVDCDCYIIYDNGRFRQTLRGTDKSWVVVNEEQLAERKTVGLAKPTKRELTARKIIGTETESKETLEARKTVGAGEVKDTSAQLNKSGDRSVNYMGKEESARFYTDQKNTAEAIVEKFGGDIKYLESVSDPSKLNWNGETWRIVRGDNFSGALKYYKGGMDGIVFDASGIPEKVIKKRLESALNSAGIAKELDIIVVRDGKVYSTLKFGK